MSRSSLPPPLRAAVQDTLDVTRLLAWSSLLGDLDSSLEAPLTELEHARTRILGAWKAGELSETAAIVALRHVVERVAFHLRALGNGG